MMVCSIKALNCNGSWLQVERSITASTPGIPLYPIRHHHNRGRHVTTQPLAVPLPTARTYTAVYSYVPGTRLWAIGDHHAELAMYVCMYMYIRKIGRRVGNGTKQRYLHVLCVYIHQVHIIRTYILQAWYVWSSHITWGHTAVGWHTACKDEFRRNPRSLIMLLIWYVQMEIKLGGGTAVVVYSYSTSKCFTPRRDHELRRSYILLL